MTKDKGKSVEPAGSGDAAERRLEAYESKISTSRRMMVAAAIDAGNALRGIRDEKLYRTAGFRSFEAYCLSKWDTRRESVDRMIRAAGVAGELKKAGLTLPTSQYALQMLSPYLKDPKELVAKYEEAQSLDPDGEVTGVMVERVVYNNAAEEAAAAADAAAGVVVGDGVVVVDAAPAVESSPVAPAPVPVPGAVVVDADPLDPAAGMSPEEEREYMDKLIRGGREAAREAREGTVGGGRKLTNNEVAAAILPHFQRILAEHDAIKALLAGTDMDAGVADSALAKELGDLVKEAGEKSGENEIHIDKLLYGDDEDEDDLPVPGSDDEVR